MVIDIEQLEPVKEEAASTPGCVQEVLVRPVTNSTVLDGFPCLPSILCSINTGSHSLTPYHLFPPRPLRLLSLQPRSDPSSPPAMRFLYLVFSVFLLVSQAISGLGSGSSPPELCLSLKVEGNRAAGHGGTTLSQPPLLPLAGYGQVLKYCPKIGYCSTKCSKMEKWARSSDCKGHCCLPDNWKWK
ncbi:UNVERIFIED_CONTAM: hypothetical protein H355_010087 [Colinus virginianus]|nr:hypothetical protein H355_010087 [Colinus virginianus]